MKRLEVLLARALAAMVAAVRAHPLAVLAAAAALTAASVWCVVARLGVDTDTAEMFAPDVPFRRHSADFKRSFPHLSDTLVAVVDGDTAATAREAAEWLHRRCADRPQLFDWVYAPTLEPYFRRNGLLFLDPPQLERFATDLRRVLSAFAPVLREPSLTRYAESLERVLAAPAEARPHGTNHLVDGLTAAVVAGRSGATSTFAWRDAFTGGAGLGEAPGGGRRVILQLKPVLDWQSFPPGEPAMRHVQQLRREARALWPGVEIGFTGEVAMAYDELRSARDGALTSLVLSALLVGLLVPLGLRSVRLSFASMATLLVGLAWTAGWAALVVGQLNLLSIAFAALYVSLGIDTAIHFGLRFRELGLQGLVPDHAWSAAAHDTGSSLFLAAVTTAFGFLAFVPTSFAGVAELGAIAGGGMLISWAATLALMPAISTLPLLRPRLRRPSAMEVVALRRDTLADLPARHARVTLLVTCLLTAAVVPVLPRLHFDADPLHLRDPGADSVATYRELLEDEQTTPHRLSVLADGAAEAAALKERLRQLPEVGGAVAIDDLVPRRQEEKLAILATIADAVPERGLSLPSLGAYGLEQRVAALHSLQGRLQQVVGHPGTAPAGADDEAALRESAGRAQHELEALERDLQRGAPAERQRLLNTIETELVRGLAAELGQLRTSVPSAPVQLSDVPESIRRHWVGADGRWRIDVTPASRLDNDDELARFLAAVRTVAPAATGGPAILVDSGRVAVEAFTQAAVWALVAIAGMLLLLLRSVRDVLLVLVPLLLAAAITGAALVLLGLQLNFANAIALPLLLGLGVDNGIHLVHRRRTSGTAEVIHTSTGRAIVFSGLTTLGGFGTLALSAHPGTASLGLLLSIGIAANLLCTFAVLPALLVLLVPRDVSPETGADRDVAAGGSGKSGVHGGHAHAHPPLPGASRTSRPS